MEWIGSPCVGSLDENFLYDAGNMRNMEISTDTLTDDDKILQANLDRLIETTEMIREEKKKVYFLFRSKMVFLLIIGVFFQFRR